MAELGLGVPFWVIALIWLAKVVLLVFISALLAWLGVRALDAIIRQVSYRERIGGDPIAVGLFVAGFFILIGLVIHGAVSGLTAVTAPIGWYESPLAAGLHVFGYLVFFGLILHAALTGPL